MIESEKESIDRKPFIEIQRETKKFRQDIFKKRHRAYGESMPNLVLILEHHYLPIPAHHLESNTGAIPKG
ncbi:hypothetical protein RJ639_042794 [Escallonia herrerae]|uniref:Uncharacterized protein n=1 Tax=Escallonia herrerae TaxID=1293975 RepID=A0AA88W9B9_9ASTE|nr:hypothetical protein RJ639_042794 [Escallonia herrerae]